MISSVDSVSCKCQISIEFIEELSIEQVALEISGLSAPQVIVWYIGCYGLRKASVLFYKDFLINPVFSRNAQAAFWLVDLTAWGAFKSSRCSIQESSSCSDLIGAISCNKIKCIKSSSLFKKMQSISEKDVIEYFKKALCKNFIHESSKTFSNRNIQIGEVFSKNCLIMADWYSHDVSKAYSVFQYFEGCLLVDEIFMQLNKEQLIADVQIVFALPNDESKYYKDKLNSFQKDVSFLISKRCESIPIVNLNLQIKFLSFKYGMQLQHRPYNAPGKIFKKNEISYQAIAGCDTRMENLATKGIKDASSI